MSQTHQAAILPQKGGPLVVAARATPDPGPKEILIQVKAVAINPVDYYQRDFGMPPVPIYPAVIGNDVAGIVVRVGSKVPDAPSLGARVIAIASSFYQEGSPDHGAFQEYALASYETIAALPERLSFEEGAVLPLASLTALSGWTTVGIPLDTRYAAQDKQAVLIWGGASSVGSVAVQSAKSMGFTVYTTASTNNHKYLTKLGADAVFDYKSDDVVSQIIKKAEVDGVALRTAHCVVEGSLQPTLDVLKHTKGNGTARVAHAPLLPPDAPTLEDTEVKFTFPPLDPAERNKHIYDCFHGWLETGLSSGTIVPSPRIEIVSGGLPGLNKALDVLKAGVSGTKIVVPI